MLRCQSGSQAMENAERISRNLNRFRHAIQLAVHRCVTNANLRRKITRLVVNPKKRRRGREIKLPERRKGTTIYIIQVPVPGYWVSLEVDLKFVLQ